MPPDRRAAGLALTLLAPLATAQEGSRPPALTPELAQAAAAYAAKVVASARFVSGRTLQSVLDEEFAPARPLDALLRPLLRFEIDEERRRVTCRLGVAKATAVATVNLGCVLVPMGSDADALQRRAAPDLADLKAPFADAEWPVGERGPVAAEDGDGIDRAALAAAIERAFTEPERGPRRTTRAVVVVHRGRLVAERYAPGCHASMPLPGWSMTKTLVDTLLGLCAAAGALDPTKAFVAPEWTAEDDPRRRLCWHDLLTMTSGLGWRESYDDPQSDTLRMLFASADHAEVQARMPLAHAPGSHFAYSSGTTNLLCRGLRAACASDLEYWALPRRLFGRLGMRTAVLETDPSGTFVGSSYGFASARDWARLGLLYADDGLWLGERVLPAGWVATSTTPAPASRGRYGRHIWLNADPDGDGPERPRWRDLPADLVHLDGHEGQYVAILPHDRLVVVRLGCTKAGGFDVAGFLAEVRAACCR